MVLFGLIVVSCSSDRSASIDVPFALKMPHFAGPGPTHTTNIDFFWTITVHGGAGVLVKSVRTQVREPTGGVVLETEEVSTGIPPQGRPFDRPTARPPVYLPENGTVTLNQEVRGLFPSELYPGAWEGEANVEVVYSSGRSEQLHASFRFQG